MFLEIDVILDPLCSAQYHSLNMYERDCLSQEAAALSRWLCDIVLSSGMFSLSNLCIESERAVWVVYVDVVCICDDGNLFDACLLAVVAALRLPHTCTAKHDKDALSLHFDLLPLTLGVLDARLIADPTRDEQRLLSDVVHVVLTSDGELVHLHKSGEGDVRMDSLDAMMGFAALRARELMVILAAQSALDGRDALEIDFQAEVEEEKEEGDAKGKGKGKEEADDEGEDGLMMNVD